MVADIIFTVLILITFATTAVAWYRRGYLKGSIDTAKAMRKFDEMLTKAMESKDEDV